MTRRYKAGKRRRGRKARRGLTVALAALIVLVVVTAVLAFANAILGVNPPGLGEEQSTNTPANMEPALCKQHGIAPTLLRTASAPNNPTTSDLILGTNTGNTLNGRGGNDCIVGGAGNDTITGGNGTDVCIGGPGTRDNFTSCEYCDTTNCTRG